MKIEFQATHHIENPTQPEPPAKDGFWKRIWRYLNTPAAEMTPEEQRAQARLRHYHDHIFSFMVMSPKEFLYFR